MDLTLTLQLENLKRLSVPELNQLITTSFSLIKEKHAEGLLADLQALHARNDIEGLTSTQVNLLLPITNPQTIKELCDNLKLIGYRRKYTSPNEKLGITASIVWTIAPKPLSMRQKKDLKDEQPKY